MDQEEVGLIPGEGVVGNHEEHILTGNDQVPKRGWNLKRTRWMGGYRVQEELIQSALGLFPSG